MVPKHVYHSITLGTHGFPSHSRIKTASIANGTLKRVIRVRVTNQINMTVPRVKYSGPKTWEQIVDQSEAIHSNSGAPMMAFVIHCSKFCQIKLSGLKEFAI